MDSDETTFFKAPVPVPQNTPEMVVEHYSAPKETAYDDDMPPSVRVASRRPAVLINLLGLREGYYSLDTKPLSEEIDSYVNAEIKRRGLPDNKSSYEELLNEYTTKLNLNESDSYSKLEKLARFTRIQSKLLKAMKEYQDVMEGDPSKMTVEKLQKLLERKYGVKSV